MPSGKNDDYLSKLPYDVARLVILKLLPEDIFHLIRTNKRFARLIRADNDLWKEKFKLHFPKEFEIMQYKASYQDKNWYNKFINQDKFFTFLKKDKPRIRSAIAIIQEGKLADLKSLVLTIDELKFLLASLPARVKDIEIANFLYYEYQTKIFPETQDLVEYYRLTVKVNQPIEIIIPILKQLIMEFIPAYKFTLFNSANNANRGDLLEYLLKNFTIDAQFIKQGKFLKYAVDKPEVLKKLMDNYQLSTIESDDKNYFSLYSAIEFSSFDTFKLLITRGARYDKNELAERAALFDRLDILEYCIKELHVDLQSDQAVKIMHEAVFNNNKKIVEYLLEKNINITDKKYHLLFDALKKPDNDIFKQLLFSKKLDPNEVKEWSPLAYACFKNNTEAAMLLLQLDNIDVNVSWGGFTALGMAVKHRNEDIFYSLLNKGVIDKINIDDSNKEMYSLALTNPQYSNRKERTAIDIEIANALLEYGANVTGADLRGLDLNRAKFFKEPITLENIDLQLERLEKQFKDHEQEELLRKALVKKLEQFSKDSPDKNIARQILQKAINQPIFEHRNWVKKKLTQLPGSTWLSAPTGQQVLAKLIESLASKENKP